MSLSFSGPQFLAFYAALAILANWLLRRFYRVRESGGAEQSLALISEDPYQIAFLRNGERETVEIVMFSLLDRGLLEESDGRLRISRQDARQIARRPIEQAVLDSFREWSRPEAALSDAAVRSACEHYRTSLVDKRLLAGPRTYGDRFLPLFAALGFTLGIAAARIVHALSQGRHNVGFLIVIAAVCAICLVGAYRKRLTGLGEATVARLRRLFDSLKSRARQMAPGGASHDAVVLAALFGLEILPVSTFPFVERIHKRRGGDGGGDGGGGGGGDSGDSGGGCGGGGCGGGCGG